MCIISEWEPPPHRPPTSHRILYAGRDQTLPDRLTASLADCQVVRSPDAATARLFLKSHTPYSALLIDAQLPGTAAAAELEHFARSLDHREQLPIHVMPPGETDINKLAETFAGLLTVLVR